MTFLHPLALLGLGAAAIPILLHLFQRRTPPELEFPAVRYLAEAERRTARRLRLRHRLLLLLRTALIAVIVLAAARPLVPLAGAGSAHPPTAVVLVLDNSLSSGATGGGRVALDRLRAAARASVAAAGPDDRLFLILADGVARAGTAPEQLAVIDALAPTPQRLDLVAAVERAARLVDAEPLAGGEVHVLSDLQRTALAAGRVDTPAGVAVLVLEPEPAVANRGIAAAEVRDGAVAVALGGTPGEAPAAVALVVRGRETGHALVAAGAEVALPLPALAPGWWTGEVRLAPDELRADDARPIAWRVAPPARASADPAAGPFAAAALAVLRDAGRAAAGGEVRIGAAPAAGAVVLPPADAALVGTVNRALGAAGARWRFGAPGTPGILAEAGDLRVRGIPVQRRYRLEGSPGAGEVLATVNGEPWLVRDAGLLVVGSRLDTAWTALPATPAFVPFVDRLVNRVARGESAVTVVAGAPGVAFTVRGRDTVGATVSAPDPRESDLTPARPAEVRRALGAAPLAAERFAAARFGGARRADLGAGLLLLALLLAALELWVAWRTR